jgi:hypothetical protein
MGSGVTDELDGVFGERAVVIVAADERDDKQFVIQTASSVTYVPSGCRR